MGRVTETWRPGETVAESNDEELPVSAVLLPPKKNLVFICNVLCIQWTVRQGCPAEEGLVSCAWLMWHETTSHSGRHNVMPRPVLLPQPSDIVIAWRRTKASAFLDKLRGLIYGGGQKEHHSPNLSPSTTPKPHQPWSSWRWRVQAQYIHTRGNSRPLGFPLVDALPDQRERFAPSSEQYFSAEYPEHLENDTHLP